jgi:hypothetical protein
MLTVVKDVVLQMLTVVLKAVKDAVYKGHNDHVLHTAAAPQPPANTETYPSMDKLKHHSIYNYKLSIVQ